MKLPSILRNVRSGASGVGHAAPPQQPSRTRSPGAEDSFEADRAQPKVELGAGQGSDADYVRGLYRSLLGREPDAGGMAAHLKGLSTGASRADILKVFLESPEFKAKHGQPTGPAGALTPTRLKTADDPNTVAYVNSPRNKNVAPRSSFIDAVNQAIDRVQAQSVGVDPNDPNRITNFDAYHSAVCQQLLQAGYQAAYDGEEMAVGRAGDAHSEQFDISTWKGEVRRFYASWQNPSAFAE